jgi:hypothetical protein
LHHKNIFSSGKHEKKSEKPEKITKIRAQKVIDVTYENEKVCATTTIKENAKITKIRGQKVIDVTHENEKVCATTTIKENEKVQQELKCRHCNTLFTDISNLRRHEKNRCSYKLEIDKKLNEIKRDFEKQILLIKSEYEKTLQEVKNKELEIRINDMKTQINDLKYANTQMHESNKISSLTLDKSVSALTYLTINRKKAPVLQQITQEKAKELLHYEKRLYDFIIHHNNGGTLDQYIGDIVLRYIKKQNPDEQSVWNSDVSRLTYLVRCLIEDEQKWQRDAKGVLFNKFVITPILNYLTEYLRTFLPVIPIVNNNTDTDTESSMDSLEMRDNVMSKTKDIFDTIETLKSKKFKTDLSIYIASHVPLIQDGSKKKTNKK